MKKFFETKYGYFSSDGSEYVIKTPFTPKPWANIICPNEFGVVVTQLGTGYTFYKNPALFRLTSWSQDIVKEEYGKYVYLKDIERNNFWSIGYKPVCKPPKKYKCIHGIGYTKIFNETNKISSELTIFVPEKDNVEVQILKIKNLDNKERQLEIFTYFEWFLRDVSTVGVHNEFQKLFIETSYFEKTIFAKKLNGILDVYGFSSSSLEPDLFTTDKEDFIGNYNSLTNPIAVKEGRLNNLVGRYVDPVSSFKFKMNLSAGEEKEIIFLIGVVENKNEVKKLQQKYFSNIWQIFDETKSFWIEKFSKIKVETQDKKIDFMTNLWLKYQSISCRINSRTGYYQPAGGIGYRDQLQDSMIYLPIQPELTKKQILLHAQHQFFNGNVYHWWLPELGNFKETGPVSKHSDPYLWLPYVTLEYLKETNDFTILDEKVGFVDNKIKTSLFDHCMRAINLSLKRMSRRGLPLIGEGDWNDGLSAAGKNWKGESIWLGHFLYAILVGWVKMIEKMVEREKFKVKSLKMEQLRLTKKLFSTAEKLKQNINKYGWDGEWFWGATKDNGELIGSKKCKEGKIFLNSQSWSIIADTIEDKERIKKMLNSMEKYLYQKYGPVLLYPAYSKTDKEIGYLTEYAPAARENGGLYVHAGCWALLMECKLKRKDKIEEIYTKLNPIYRSMEPDLYKTEPYVTCGDIYGPASPLFGQGGWSWYSGSAQWLFKVTVEWIFGIRPTYDGLLVTPVLPKGLNKVKVTRYFRDSIYEIEIIKKTEDENPIQKVFVDGKIWNSNILPVFKDKKEHKIKVVLNK
ncbi:MAG: glycosyl transferase family 36 [Endomicrobiia bacterium]